MITALNSKPPVSVASRIRKYLAVPVENHHLKMAIHLARGPEAYRYFAGIFGFWSVDNELLSGTRARGELIGQSEKAITLLTQVVSYL